MAQDVTEGVLTFVLVSALAAILWLELRNRKRSSKKESKSLH
jgi:hypothetical protein